MVPTCRFSHQEVESRRTTTPKKRTFQDGSTNGLDCEVLHAALSRLSNTDGVKSMGKIHDDRSSMLSSPSSSREYRRGMSRCDSSIIRWRDASPDEGVWIRRGHTYTHIPARGFGSSVRRAFTSILLAAVVDPAVPCCEGESFGNKSQHRPSFPGPIPESRWQGNNIWVISAAMRACYTFSRFKHSRHPYDCRKDMSRLDWGHAGVCKFRSLSLSLSLSILNWQDTTRYGDAGFLTGPMVPLRA
jgi:hypothetical protein